MVMPMSARALSLISSLAILSVLAPLPALANDYRTISDEAAFLDLVADKELRLGILAIRLRISADGTIAGSAAGWDISGSWNWQDGYFCREMDWSGMPIPYNCQLVEARGTEEVRFTVDRGAGESAAFNIR